MKTTAYDQWFKDPSDFSIRTDILDVVASVMDGGKYGAKKISFTKYPPELMTTVLSLKERISEEGFDSDDPAIKLTYLVTGQESSLMARIPLASYGDSSIQFISVNSAVIGKQYTYSGENMVFLSISVKSPINVYITGSSLSLSKWNGFNPIPLQFQGGRGGPFWGFQLPLIAGESIEFKLLTANGYEAGDNRRYTAGTQDDSLYVDLSSSI